MKCNDSSTSTAARPEAPRIQVRRARILAAPVADGVECRIRRPPPVAETGADHGMWSFQRYRTWLENRTNWFIPGQTPEAADSEPEESPASAAVLPAFLQPKQTAKPEKKTFKAEKQKKKDSL